MEASALKAEPSVRDTRFDAGTAAAEVSAGDSVVETEDGAVLTGSVSAMDSAADSEV